MQQPSLHHHVNVPVAIVTNFIFPVFELIQGNIFVLREIQDWNSLPLTRIGRRIGIENMSALSRFKMCISTTELGLSQFLHFSYSVVKMFFSYTVLCLLNIRLF